MDLRSRLIFLLKSSGLSSVDARNEVSVLSRDRVIFFGEEIGRIEDETVFVAEVDFWVYEPPAPPVVRLRPV
jgi:hypothetical protein